MHASNKPRSNSLPQSLTVAAPILEAYRQSGKFVPCAVDLDEAACLAFVAFRHNPRRFAESNFDGDWSILDQHPEVGEIRLVAIVESRHRTWLVGRQGSSIFAAPG